MRGNLSLSHPVHRIIGILHAAIRAIQPERIQVSLASNLGPGPQRHVLIGIGDVTESWELFLFEMKSDQKWFLKGTSFGSPVLIGDFLGDLAKY